LRGIGQTPSLNINQADQVIISPSREPDDLQSSKEKPLTNVPEAGDVYRDNETEG